MFITFNVLFLLPPQEQVLYKCVCAYTPQVHERLSRNDSIFLILSLTSEYISDPAFLSIWRGAAWKTDSEHKASFNYYLGSSSQR